MTQNTTTSTQDALRVTESLQGLRILIIEDEALIAMMLEDMLADLGCEVVGSAATLPAALEMLASGTLDAAIVDLNLAGESAVPAVQGLQARGIPVILSTGYGQVDGVARDGAVTLPKPYDAATLREKLLEALKRDS